MFEKHASPQLMLCEYKDGGGWHVEAIVRDGVAANIGGFHSDVEARDWISAKSAAYFEAREH